MNNNKCNCINCVYCVKWESIGAFRCRLNKSTTEKNLGLAVCMFDRDNIGHERARKVLHDYQAYRRGKGGIKDCPPPYVIGLAIDKAIRCMRMF